MGEEVEGLDFDDAVALALELLEVPDLGGGITGDVDDAFGREGEELGEKLGITAFSWRVDDDGGLAAGEGDVGEDVFGGAGEDGDVVDVVVFGVPACPIGGGFGDLDTGDGFEVFGEGEGEKAGATVGIDEESAVLFGLGGDVVDEGGEDEGVILEKVSGEEAELEIADGFLGDVPGVGMDAVVRGAEEEGGALLEFFGGLLDAFSFLGEGVVDFLHGNRAVGDIDDAIAGAGVEEADGAHRCAPWLLKVRGDFGTIVPGLR